MNNGLKKKIAHIFFHTSKTQGYGLLSYNVLVSCI